MHTCPTSVYQMALAPRLESLLDQVRAVDKVRLAKRLGAVSAKALAGTLSKLQEVFAE